MHKAQIRFGDPLLIATAGLLGALGDADEFPQGRAGIEALIATIAKGPEGEEVWATYEDPDGPLTYLGAGGTWVAAAGEGRLRVRQSVAAGEEPASNVWILGPDGSLSDPETIEGYGAPEDELAPEVIAEIELMERRRREAAARRPEMERRSKERQNRHRLEHLLGVVAGPPGQDRGGPVVTHLVLYDTGLIVNYLVPRPRQKDPDPDEPWDLSDTAPQEITLDDGLETEFSDRGGSVDQNGKGMLRCTCEFSPAIPDHASRLEIGLDMTNVTIELGPA